MKIEDEVVAEVREEMRVERRPEDDHLGQRAKDALEVLRHPLVLEAFVYLETQNRRYWETTGVEQEAERERAWALRKALHDFRGYFTRLVEGGRVDLRVAAERGRRRV